LGAQTHLKSDAALWVGVLLPPAAWAADLTVSYSLVKWTCGHQATTLLRGITFATLVVIASAAWIGWTAYRENERARAMALAGILTAALFSVLTIALAIPRWVFDVCQ
jgi:hypothetical protein